LRLEYLPFSMVSSRVLTAGHSEFITLK
jgi:hypothetical protein